MKIKYAFATGETTEVEVNDDVGTIILDSRRMESNSDRMLLFFSLYIIFK